MFEKFIQVFARFANERPPFQRFLLTRCFADQHYARTDTALAINEYFVFAFIQLIDQPAQFSAQFLHRPHCLRIR